MLRHTLVTTAAVLATSASLVHAGPGCMNGKQAMGWGPQPAMAGPGYGSYGQMPGYGSHARMPGYGYSAPARGMYRPQYSPMMAGTGQPGYYPPAPAAKLQHQHQHQQAAVASSKPQAEVVDTNNVTVRIKGMRFEPSMIKVEPGTTVTWIHEAGAPHTVTGGNGELQSSTMTGGQSFSHTFSEAGSYDYACNFHPMMKGQVVVEGSAS